MISLNNAEDLKQQYISFMYIEYNLKSINQTSSIVLNSFKHPMN